MINALTIDLEDWFCADSLSKIIRTTDWDKMEIRIIKNTNIILELLSKYRTKATFFVLGWIAERYPELVLDIHKRGHEIATHGYFHTPLTRMTPTLFNTDLKKAIEIKRHLISEDILGYRSPSFALTLDTLWAFDIMIKNGIKYDSSIYPVKYHPNYGLSQSPLEIFKPNLSLIEVPLSCLKLFGMNVPCSGGGYFRFYPYVLYKKLFKRCNQLGRPVIFYLHPWEIDAAQPVVPVSILKRIRHYYNLNKTLTKFQYLIQDFEFTSLNHVLDLKENLNTLDLEKFK